MDKPETTPPPNFIRYMVEEDNRTGKFGGKVITRFPPEPNGYLHIGHAKSICLNFGLAQDYNGSCNFRFDDTNPSKEEVEYVESIQADVRWLGFDWGDRLYYASDYFEQLYGWAVQLVKDGKAFVCELSPDEIREYRGTLTAPGKESPWRNRPSAENLELLARMRAGEFADGSLTLRAKIDMAAANINLRDPVMYRIKHDPHHRTGDTWCIYPMYDWAHGQCDSIEGITHSICTMEYEDHRALYDWYLDQLGLYHPQQIEFARLNLSHTVLSKRRLIQLVKEGHVNGWDDPRMPTLAGMRRRGYPPAAIRTFCERIGVGKRENLVDMALLDYCVREELNRGAPRVMAVLRPLKVVIENFPAGQVEYLEAVNNPEDPAAGTRPIPFTREIYLEREDFMENPPKKFYRLSPGREVRLRYAFFLKCHDVIKDPASGEVLELRCTYAPETRGGQAPDGRQVKATLHWVSADQALPAEVRLYDRLFTVPHPSSAEGDFKQYINPASLEVLQPAWVEPSLATAAPGSRWQFERLGYFCVDPDTGGAGLVFNRTVTLRDAWAKLQQTDQKGKKS